MEAMSEPATPPGTEPAGELHGSGSMTAEQPVPEPPLAADPTAADPTAANLTTEHAVPLLEQPHPLPTGPMLTPAATPVPSGSSHTPVKLLAQPQSSKRPVSQPLNLIPKRRSSSRSIKRKKFDDELVESSLAKTSRMKGTPPTPTAGAGGAVGLEPGRPLAPSVEQLPSEKKKVSKSSSSKRVKKSKQLVQVAKDLGRWKPSDDLLLINGVLQDYDCQSDEESSCSSEEDGSEAQENTGRPPVMDGVRDDRNSSTSDSGDSSSSDSEESSEEESQSLKRSVEAARWNEMMRILHVMHFRQERLIAKINSLQKQLKKLKKKRAWAPEPFFRPNQWPFVVPRKQKKKHDYNAQRSYVERRLLAHHLFAAPSAAGRNVQSSVAHVRQHAPPAGAPGRAASFEAAADEDGHPAAAMAQNDAGFPQMNATTSPARPNIPSSHCHAEESPRPALGGTGVRVKSEHLQECPHTIDQNGQILQASAMSPGRPASVGSGEALVVPGHSPLSDGYRGREDAGPHFANVSPDSQLGHAGLHGGGGHHSYSSGSPSPTSPHFLPASGTPQIMEIYSGLEPAAMGGQPNSPYLSEYQMSFPMRSPSKVGFRVANYSGSLVYIGGADSLLTVSKCALEQCLASAPDPRKFLGKLADKVFTREEMATSNVKGGLAYTKGVYKPYNQLDPVKVNAILDEVEKWFPGCRDSKKMNSDLLRALNKKCSNVRLAQLMPDGLVYREKEEMDFN